MSALFAILLIIPILACATQANASPYIAKSGKAGCVIALPNDATPGERYAARELRDHIKQITGVGLTEITESKLTASTGPFISIGRTTLSKKYVSEERLRALGDDGYTVFSKNGNAFFVGGRKRGSMYAVYDYLESLGVRWYSPEYTVIPKIANVPMPTKPFEYIPKLWYRDQWWNNATTSEWLARMRVNGSNGQDHVLPDSMGGSTVTMLACHSYKTIVNPAENFAKHPEWFAVKEGGNRSEGELCLTNPELRDFMAQRVIADLTQRQGKVDNYWVSQNDGGGSGCFCEKCTAERTAHGGKDRWSANTISLASCVANKVKASFPKTRIKTLAYSYTQAAPVGMSAPDNLLVEICGNFSESDPAHSDLVAAWSKVAKNISVYTYGGSNYGYWWPYPNLRDLGMQYPLALASGVKAFYVQGTALGKGSGMVDLRAYLTARMAWDPSRDVNKEISDFCTGFYGPGGKYVVEYLDWFSNYIKQRKIVMDGGWGDDNRWRQWVDKPAMDRCDKLFVQALEATKGSPVYLSHVRRAYLEVLWGGIMIDLQPNATLNDKELAVLPGVDAATIRTKAKMFGEIMRGNGYNKWSECVEYDSGKYPH